MTTLARLMESPMAERLARAHLHFLWQGLVVGIVAWLLLAAMRSDPGARAGPHQAVRLRHQLLPGGDRDVE